MKRVVGDERADLPEIRERVVGASVELRARAHDHEAVGAAEHERGRVCALGE
jgi:hypothetical protein